MKKGEVWRIQKGAKEALAVILSVREPVATVLELFGDWKNYDNVEVKTLFGDTYYVQPMYMQYCFENNFIEQEDALTAEMFAGLQKIITDCLELPVQQPELHKLEENQDQKIICDLQSQLEERENIIKDLGVLLEERKQTFANILTEVETLKSQLDTYESAIKELEGDLWKAKVERDLYKLEFKELLDQCWKLAQR